VVRDQIPVNAARLVKLPAAASTPEVRPLLPEKVEAMRAYLLAGNQLDHAALVSLLGYAGLRPQEALALSWAHVRDRTLLIEQRVVGGAIKRSTKTRQNRTVRLLAPVVQELKELRMWQRRPADEALEGRPITYVAAQLGHLPAMTLRTYAHVFEEFEDVDRRSAEEAIQRARRKFVPSQYLLEQRA
jgi:integrase